MVVVPSQKVKEAAEKAIVDLQSTNTLLRTKVKLLESKLTES